MNTNFPWSYYTSNDPKIIVGRYLIDSIVKYNWENCFVIQCLKENRFCSDPERKFAN